MEDQARGIISIKQVIGLLADLRALVNLQPVGQKEADHFQPYPPRNSYVVQFVSKAPTDADEHAECCNDPQPCADWHGEAT